MRLVVDADVLVGVLLRHRGQELIADPRLELFVAEMAWNETHYELRRRAEARVRRGQVEEGTASTLTAWAWKIAEASVTIVVADGYSFLENWARRRIPRDANDWPTVALALALDAGIWTNDGDFLGCGCPTWVTETLLAEVASW
jgi:predicted nucleic acid-binding protein